MSSHVAHGCPWRTVRLTPSPADEDRAKMASVEGNVRVLLVDDQGAYLRAMGSVVAETAGFETVGEAMSGEEGLALARELLPDLVLMDVNLPGIDGVAASRMLLSGGEAPVVLLLSTYDADAGAAFLEESGAFAYLTKSELGPARLMELWAKAAG